MEGSGYNFRAVMWFPVIQALLESSKRSVADGVGAGGDSVKPVLAACGAGDLLVNRRQFF